MAKRIAISQKSQLQNEPVPVLPLGQFESDEDEGNLFEWLYYFYD